MNGDERRRETIATHVHEYIHIYILIYIYIDIYIYVYVYGHELNGMLAPLQLVDSLCC